ncbi:MAG TPA: tetratricopeptide repeat protein, partial [bacterium]|nr:tetratricopeptide repeat protein [bacterium]
MKVTGYSLSWGTGAVLALLAVLVVAVCAAAANDARSMMQAAKETYDGGDFTRALTQFSGIVASYPRTFEGQQAAYYQGRCLEQLGRT